MATKRLIVFALTSYEKNGEDQTKWTRIGRAFENKDGSTNIELEALPVSGRMQIREETDEEVSRREQRNAGSSERRR